LALAFRSAVRAVDDVRIIPLIVVLLATAGARDAAAQDPSLTAIGGGLFRFHANGQIGILFVSEDAALVADPLDISSALWLRRELGNRFPCRRITTVVYTSDTFERIVGAVVFPGATVVGHHQLNTNLLKQRTLPASLASLDRNRDGQLQTAEWANSDGATFVAAADRDKDGNVTAREARRIVPLVMRSFRDGASISVGSTQVETLNAGNAVATPALLFRDERVLYVGSNPVFALAGFGFGSAKVSEVLQWLHGVAKLPFDTVITADRVLTRDAFDEALRYAEDLQRAAADGYLRGWSTERTAAATPFAKYAGTPVDARRRAGIDHFFRTAGVSRLELQGAAFARKIERDPHYCADYACSLPDNILGGSGALRLTKSRFGVIVEGSFGEQYLAQREGYLDDEAFAQRSSRGSFLFRFGKTRPSSLSADLVVGPSIVTNDTVGVTRVKQSIAPRGGRFPFRERKTAIAATAGINLVAPFSRAVSLYLPLRATWLAESVSPAARRPDRLDFQAGVGFSIRLSQSVH
jgi:hypothetical protein